MSSKDNHIILGKYLRYQLLGKGGSSKCYRIRCRDTKDIYVLKLVNKKLLVSNNQRRCIIFEIDIHSSLEHQHIVRFHKHHEDDNYYYLMIEFCKYRTLLDVLKYKTRLTECETRYFIYQVLLGYQYIHDNNIIHRDLKLANIFLYEDMQVKIGDFGLATKVQTHAIQWGTRCGTPNYVAPEIISHKDYNYKVDIWSIGVMIYTMLVGVPPFEMSSVGQTYRKIKAATYDFPSDIEISECAKNLMRMIFQLNPEDRPCISEIMNHEFFRDTPKVYPMSLKEYVDHCNSTK